MTLRDILHKCNIPENNCDKELDYELRIVELDGFDYCIAEIEIDNEVKIIYLK